MTSGQGSLLPGTYPANSMLRSAYAATLVTIVFLVEGVHGASYTGTPPSNVSAPLGTNASFYCEITGTQDAGQTHNFKKVSPEVLFIAADSTPSNATKFSIDLLYQMTISDLVLSDEGMYQCDMFPEEFQFYLQVTDHPTTIDMYWPGGVSYTTPGEAANLTCKAGRSHPPASFRWFRGLTDITNDAYTPDVTTDNKGYGEGVSMQQFTFTEKDEGTSIKCIVDMPDTQEVLSQTLPVSFSGADTAHVSFGVLLGAVFILLTQT